MRRLIISAIAVLAGCFVCNSSVMAQRLITAGSTTGHQSYQDGESLTYTVKYGFVTGGKGIFTVRDTVINGIKTNHIVVRGVTTGIADVFYKVRDSYESYVDPTTQLPVLAIRNISEGRYKRYEEVTYDHEAHKVNSSRKGIADIPENTLDMVSAFYHARNNTFNEDLIAGDTIRYETYFSGQVFPLVIRYLGKETISTNIGKIQCYKFAPVTEVGRSFKSEDDMNVWISCDDNHVPVKIKFNLAVGSFVCELTDYKGMKYPIKKA